jgi:large subunit ribosomal protein L15
MKLNELRDNEGARRPRIRKGRGIGSGKGKTAARGQKGQKSRSGVAIKGFEGGQMPLHMRIPKRGFNNPFGKDFAEVNIGMVQKAIDAKKLDGKKTVDHAALQAAGLARGGKDGVRLLGKGAITAKVKFEVAGASKGAVAAVEKAGGSVDIKEVKTPSSKRAGSGQGRHAGKDAAGAQTSEKKAPAKKAAPKKTAAKAAKTAEKGE